jgi:photosystem II stability/assembly factor-like uncharacterized protein
MNAKHPKPRRVAVLTASVVCLLALSLTAPGATIYYWYSIGPQPINRLDNSNNIQEQDSGRVTALAVDPTNSSHWLMGAAQGGIWETTDDGTSFNPTTDDQASMAMGAIAFAPGKPSLVYAGTGEANFRGDAYAGAGLLVSTNGGANWQMLNTSFARTSFSRIRVNPMDSSNLMVATARGGGGIGEEALGNVNVPGSPPRGVFISTTGGTSFVPVLTGEATALEANPANFCEQYAGLGEIYGDVTNGVYRTTNCWQSSQLIQGPWPPLVTNVIYISTNYPIATNLVVTCYSNLCSSNFNSGHQTNDPTCTNVFCYTTPDVITTNVTTGTNITVSFAEGRISMASSPSDPNTLYVGIAYSRTNYLAGLYGIWVTTNAWATTPSWTQLPPPPVMTDNVSTPRFWYMFDLLVDPTNAAVLYLAEFNVWRYASGNWTRVEGWPGVGHPDNHVMVWLPQRGQTNNMMLGNDGGLLVSDPGVPGTWTSLNDRLRITQFYKGAAGATGYSPLVLGGAQDEFTSLYTGNPAWPKVDEGDGGDCAISKSDPYNDWATSEDTATDSPQGQNTCQIERTLFGFSPVGTPPTAAGDIDDVMGLSKQFYVHFEKAPFNDDLLIAGTSRLWMCTNFFSGIPSWSPNGPTMLDTNGIPVPISAMAFAPSDTTGSTYAYSTEDGQLRITFNGGTNWQDLDPANVVPNRYVSGLAFSPTDANTLYVTLSGFDEGAPGQPGHLFKTSNASASPPIWTNISPPVDLPNNCLAINPTNAQNIYVGTDIGVWSTGNGGASWFPYGPSSGMPNVAVYDLRFSPNNLLVAFTHGRGAFILTPINLPILVIIRPNFHPTPNCLQCPPYLSFLNPGDQVSLPIALQNILTVDTVDLKATMLPSAQITPLTGTQDYGVVRGQGQSVSRTFQFIAGGAAGGPGGAPPVPGPGGNCGDTVQVVLQLQDGGVDLGQVSIPFRLGEPSFPLVQDFEAVQPPYLAPGWTSAASGTEPPWTTTTNPPPSMPDMGEDEDTPPAAPVTNTIVFVPDPIGNGQSYLTSPPFVVATTQAQLFFLESFNVAKGSDGGVLEIAIGSQPFQDITLAGGSFVKDGYNTVLDRSPLGIRPAWSGDSGGWLPVVVNLPAAAAGQSVQLRWRFASLNGMFNGGWFVDAVLVTEPICLPPVTNPVMLNPAVQTNTFTFSINTVLDRNYVIEYKTNLNDAAWQTLETLPGNGSNQVISVPTGSNTQLYYRFYVQ